MTPTVLSNRTNGNPKVCGIEATDETLSSRGGLVLFAKYLESLCIAQLLAGRFSRLRKSAKGAQLGELFKQVLCFFADGTDFSMTRFDELQKDEGYAGVIESRSEKLVSSHTAKRFFKAFGLVCTPVFRAILRRLFIWRLKTERPEVIEITIDSMVMDNDDALKRHGVQPTYKKVKGFQPLHAIWNGLIVDAVFRGGKKNGNAGNTVALMARELVRLIRKEYDERAVIVFRLDAGFFDQDNFKVFDELGVGFVCSGKMYEDVKTAVAAIPAKQWQDFRAEKQTWQYAEWSYQAGSWKKAYRAIYTRLVDDETGQGVLEFARPDNVIVTNLQEKSAALKHCSKAQVRELSCAATIIASHHQRGADELPHRGIKDFGTQQLPFKRFAPNAAYYYLMVVGYFLFCCFKRDVVAETHPELAQAYATTVRRKLIDVAVKVIRRGRQIFLKVARAAFHTLMLDKLWARAVSCPAIPI